MASVIERHLFRAGTVLWVVLWAVFIVRLAWLDARLRAHLAQRHAHRWRRLPCRLLDRQVGVLAPSRWCGCLILSQATERDQTTAAE